MIKELGDAIVARLESTGVFRRVERAVTGQTLNNPPVAVVILVRDAAEGDGKTQAAESRRLLTWRIVVIGHALPHDRGRAGLDECIDATRRAFHQWIARPEGGCLPAEIGDIVLVDEDDNRNLLEYAADLKITVFPRVWDRQTKP